MEENQELTQAQTETIEYRSKVKGEGLLRVIQEYIEKNDMPFVSLFTVNCGMPLAALLDSLYSSKDSLDQSLPHNHSGAVVVHSAIREIEDAVTNAGNWKSLEDGALVSLFSYLLLQLENTKMSLNVISNELGLFSRKYEALLREMDKRGLVPMRAVLKPLKMNTKYKVITETGEFVASYDDQLLFTLEEIPDVEHPGVPPSIEVPKEKVVFIGNIQSNGEVHHLDDLPIFSTHTMLLFGKAGAIGEPIFNTSPVKAVVELNEVN